METIRKASQNDIDKLIIWGQRFHALSNWVTIPFNEAAFRQTLLSVMGNENACLLMHSQGMVAGFVAPLWFSDRHITAQEMFWYAESDGGQLLDALEDWSRQKGAEFLITSGLKDDSGRIQKLYESKGYEIAEYHYRKRLRVWESQRQLG